MKDLPPLEGLSSEEKNALIRERWAVVQVLQAKVEKLKGKPIKKSRAIRVCHRRKDLSLIQRALSPAKANERQAWVERVGDET